MSLGFPSYRHGLAVITVLAASSSLALASARTGVMLSGAIGDPIPVPEFTIQSSVGQPSVGPQAVSPQAGETKIKPDGSNLFVVLASNWNRTRFAGTRRFSLFVDGLIYDYDEAVVAAGDGRFSLKLAAVHDRPYLRRKVFESRAGFLYQYRDFRIHDAALAQKNYTVTPMGAVIRARRRMLVFDVTPRVRTQSSYRILVDDEYAIVLDQLEFGPKGRVVSSLFYSTIRFGNSVRNSAPGTWWKPRMDVREHASLAGAKSRLDFTPHSPTRLGDGFARSAIRTTITPFDHRRFLSVAYTDGIDTRFVIQSLRTDTNAVPVLGQSPQARELVPVMRYRFGPVTQLLVRYREVEYLVLGSFPTTGEVPGFLDNIVP